MARRKAPIIADELLDQLLAGRDPQSALGRDGLVEELKRALAERALNAEMDHHLDGEVADGQANSRNGYGRKTLLTDSGKLSNGAGAQARSRSPAVPRGHLNGILIVAQRRST